MADGVMRQEMCTSMSTTIIGAHLITIAIGMVAITVPTIGEAVSALDGTGVGAAITALGTTGIQVLVGAIPIITATTIPIIAITIETWFTITVTVPDTPLELPEMCPEALTAAEASILTEL